MKSVRSSMGSSHGALEPAPAGCKPGPVSGTIHFRKGTGMNRVSCHAVVLALVASCAAPAWSQTYPSKTIRIVVGYTAGGTADLVSRLLARNMSDKLGQQVFVDNRPSSGGLLANELVANAA